MGRFDLIFFYLPTIVLIFIQYCSFTITITAQPLPSFLSNICGGLKNTADTTFQSNLINLLLPSLSSSNKTAIKNGYYNTTAGRNPNIVYGSFQCRGDITSESCQVCVDTAAVEIMKSTGCPNYQQGIIWYSECMLRFSNQSYFTFLLDGPRDFLPNPDNIDNPDQFNKIIANLLDDIVKQAVSSSTSLFATGERKYMNSQRIYGLVQCTSDISPSYCNMCLRAAINDIPRCCEGKKGASILRASCYMRYDMSPFFESRSNEAPAPSLPATPLTNTTTTSSNGKNKSKLAVYVVVPLVIAVLSTIAIWCFCFRRKKKFHAEDVVGNVESLQFDFSIIRAATNNFCDANKLGEGGFGSVYKGALLDGQEIAVKRLSANSGQGEEEFKNEVVLLAKLQHRNLVNLLGFCLHGQEKILIYEFMLNASLDRFIFDSIKRTYLDWERRYKIIAGIAKGVLYLHEDSRLRIIHRDLKASNVLLGADMNPKIADFGMARMFAVDQTQDNTNRIVGTYGYMAPEYAMQGHFSVKSDVFSFGVLVLEIINGKKNNSFNESISGGSEDLLSYAWKHWKNETALELLDPSLRESYSSSEVMRCIHIGLLCVQEDVTKRPTMASIILMLNNHSLALPLPSPPAYCVSEESIKEAWTVNKVSISELDPR